MPSDAQKILHEVPPGGAISAWIFVVAIVAVVLMGLFSGLRPAFPNADGELVPKKVPHIELSVPILFSAMSYGSISYNAHESLARAATQLGTCYNTGEGGLHEDFYKYGPNTIVQVASGRFGDRKSVV